MNEFFTVVDDERRERGGIWSYEEAKVVDMVALFTFTAAVLRSGGRGGCLDSVDGV